MADLYCVALDAHNPHSWVDKRLGQFRDTHYCPGVTARQAAHVQPNEGAPRRAGTVTTPDGLDASLRTLAARYDDHADDIDLGPGGEPTRRAAAQLRLVATLYRDGIYDRTTAYVWLQAGRRLLVELLDLHEIEHRG
jgi:hypothetical protein